MPSGKPRASTLRFYGNEFVFDTVSGMFFRLSSTGSFVLRALDDGMKAQAIITALQSRFGIDRATALRDLELFLNDIAALEPLDHFTDGEQIAG